MQHSDVIIIGGGTAGRTLVHYLHTADNYVSVTVIKDEEININRCALPYGIASQKPAGKFFIPNKLITYFGAELVIDSVEGIDTEGSQLTTAAGKSFSYNHLVFATGAQPLFPPFHGVDAPQVVGLRSQYDLIALREFARKMQKAVVLGGSYIGVEVAAVLQYLNVQITLIEILPNILSSTLEEEFAKEIEQYLTKNGIEIRTNARIVEILTTEGQVSGVQFDDGTKLETDFVVLATGFVPDTELARQSGIEVSAFGIVTDEFLRTNIQNIYASGDCAEKKSFITKKPVRGEFETNAVFMSKVVGANILGHQKTFPGVINTNTMTAFNLSCGSAGLTERVARDELDIVTGCSEVLSKYPMMDGAERVRTKLIFERHTRKIIGGSVLRYGYSTASDVDFIAFAIQMGATVEDILLHQYTTHPELTPKSSDNMYVLAAQDALKKL
jgi:NADH oxidase (H2O2-forming)